MSDVPPPTCLVTDCGRPAKSRGLCSRCVKVAYRLIQEGKTSWAELERRGLALPVGNRGPKPRPTALGTALTERRRAGRKPRIT